MGGEELKWCQLAHHRLMSQHKGLILVHAVKLKQMIKAQISGRMASSGISDVVFGSVYSEKTHLKKLIIILIIITSLTRRSVEHCTPHADGALLTELGWSQ